MQQLPVGDHGGRMNTQMKGFTEGARRVSARLKKWEALRPQTSARPSSLNNADGEKQGAQMSLNVVQKKQLTQIREKTYRKCVELNLRPSLYK